MTIPPYRPDVIAQAIIRLFNIKGKSITPLQLQKLLYFAHGWNLAIFNKPLLNCAIENWKYGPVVGEIYHKYKSFGQNSILIDISIPPDLDKDSSTLIDKIYEVYGKYNGIQLSSMSHIPNGPWDKTKEKAVIDDGIISDWFKAQAKTSGGKG